MITQQELKQNLHYNPKTGVFKRIKAIGRNVKVGDVAGSLRKDGYLAIRVNGQKYLSHRLAWLYVYGCWPVAHIDHKNLLRDDNRLSNLREATNSQNTQNVHIRNTNTSGCRGVYWNKRLGKWEVQVGVNGKKKYLGVFEKIDVAILVREESAKKLHGEFYRKSTY